MIEERRKHQRAKSQLAIKIADKSFDVITDTVNVSPSGIYCRVTRMLPLMSKIELVLLVPARDSGKYTKKIRGKGVVVRAEPVILKDTDQAHYNVAIFFTDVSKRDQKILESYLNSNNIHGENSLINN